MKNIVLFLILIIPGIKGHSQELTLMTYNVRYATVNDGENQWDKRKEFLSQQLGFYAPDVFGIQEGLEQQVTFIDNYLANYNYIGVGRDDGKSKGEYCAIFYKEKRCQLLAQSTFWLSETPESVSKGWDAAYERICTYAFFMDKETGHNFWVFNTHFDHLGEIAREKSAALIVQKINEINKDGFPVFILGDLNLNEKSKPIKYLSSLYHDSRQVTQDKPFGPFGTFTAFAFDEPVQDRIDYIFVSKNNIRVHKYGVLTDSKDFKYPSDHFPVIVKASLN